MPLPQSPQMLELEEAHGGTAKKNMMMILMLTRFMSWYPGVMRRIHTAATCRESTASLNKTDNTESASGKNPHGSEVERIHNSGKEHGSH